MPVDLSIKRVPDDLAERLRERAKRNHRSLQGELRAILEDAADMRGSGITREAVERFSRGRGTMTIADLNDAVQRLGISTPDSSVEIIRQMRDVRGEHIEQVLEQSRRRSRRVRGR